MSASVDRPHAVIVLLAGGRRRVVATVRADVSCDLDLVDRLLLLRLGAQRRGWSLLLEDVDDELHELLDLVGVTRWLTPP
jgi:hypothetical protein